MTLFQKLCPLIWTHYTHVFRPGQLVVTKLQVMYVLQIAQWFGDASSQSTAYVRRCEENYKDKSDDRIYRQSSRLYMSAPQMMSFRNFVSRLMLGGILPFRPWETAKQIQKTFHHWPSHLPNALKHTNRPTTKAHLCCDSARASWGWGSVASTVPGSPQPTRT